MLGSHLIKQEVALGGITIEPFIEENVGPNSVDLRLGSKVAVVVPNHIDRQGNPVINTRLPGKFEYIEPNEDGAFVLLPGKLYLGHTVEAMGSNIFAPLLHGRSTSARHGLVVHLTAGFCDVGWFGQIVLEMVIVTQWPMFVFPGDRVCQVEFDRVEGVGHRYNSTYQGQKGIKGAKGISD